MPSSFAAGEKPRLGEAFDISTFDDRAGPDRTAIVFLIFASRVDGGNLPVPLNALLLVVAAAVCHASWNLIVKQVTEKQIFTWWTLVAGCLFYLPILYPSLPLPIEVWPYALSSAAAEVFYFIALVRAYEQGDFSLVYPIARGAAPALLVVWAAVFLGERPDGAGIAGIATLLLGLTIVGAGQLWSRQGLTSMSAVAIGWALLISLSISIYGLIDGAAVRIVDPKAYGALVLLLTGVFLAPIVISRYGWRRLLREGRSHVGRIFAVSGLTLLTFVLVLEAFTMGRVSYVAALRELSVVFAALAGWLWMGEAFGLARTLGAVLIFAGIAVIALAG